MGDETGISWTDHTFNPWWGCTAIAPGCDNCYAAAFDKRTGGDYWNPKVKPRRTRPENWRKVLKWNEQAEIENRRHRVFCGSMMDWQDNKAPDGASDDLWRAIRATPMLDWQLLTKRSYTWKLPHDWGDGYKNVWLGVTAEDIKHGLNRIHHLRQAPPAIVKFVSAEPLLENLTGINLEGIDWLIIGGESGPNCRPMKKEWVQYLIDAADEFDVSVWFKQWGGNTKDKGGSLINGIELKQWPKGHHRNF